MDLAFFENVISEVSQFTREVACHVMGDPLTHPRLHAYLDIIHAYGLKAVLTTSGYYLKKQSFETLFHPAVKQINISLNSYNKNDTALTLPQYMEPIVALCQEKLKRQEALFINLRIWNLDETCSERVFNQEIFSLLSS
jgi:hypothetical protein